MSVSLSILEYVSVSLFNILFSIAIMTDLKSLTWIRVHLEECLWDILWSIYGDSTRPRHSSRELYPLFASSFFSFSFSFRILFESLIYYVTEVLKQGETIE